MSLLVFPGLIERSSSEMILEDIISCTKRHIRHLAINGKLENDIEFIWHPYNLSSLKNESFSIKEHYVALSKKKWFSESIEWEKNKSDISVDSIVSKVNRAIGNLPKGITACIKMNICDERKTINVLTIGSSAECEYLFTVEVTASKEYVMNIAKQITINNQIYHDVNISTDFINNIERNKRAINNICMISEICNIIDWSDRSFEVNQDGIRVGGYSDGIVYPISKFGTINLDTIQNVYSLVWSIIEYHLSTKRDQNTYLINIGNVGSEYISVNVNIEK